MDKIKNLDQREHLRLLFFTPYFYPYISGITQYPFKLFSDATLFCKTTCLTFKYSSKLEDKVAINNDLTIQRMPFLFRISKGFISPQSLSFFWNQATKNDVIVLNLPSIEGIFLALITKLNKKPLIALLHCEVLLPFSPLNFIVNHILNYGVYLQLLLADKIIVETKDYFNGKSYYSRFKNKIVEVLPLVNNAALDSKYQSELTAMKKGYSPIVGFCGRIAAEKGIEVLIESISTFENTLLLFAGPTGTDVVGENNYYAKIQNILKEKKIPHVFLGILSAEQLISFYKALDVLVLPSLNKTEAFGMVQAEAMLQGTPVVASHLPGVRVPIQLTKMGILTTPSNSLEITKAIQTILENKSNYSNPQLIHNVKTIFDQGKVVEKIQEILSQTI